MLIKIAREVIEVLVAEGRDEIERVRINDKVRALVDERTVRATRITPLLQSRITTP